MPAPIVIYNEMQIVSPDEYVWIEDPDNPPLEDAGSSQFIRLKQKAELSVSIDAIRKVYLLGASDKMTLIGMTKVNR